MNLVPTEVVTAARMNSYIRDNLESATFLRDLDTLMYEIGFRALVRLQSQQRDMRWWRGLDWRGQR